VRTEAFLTLVVPESRLAKTRQGGRGRPRGPRPSPDRPDRPRCEALLRGALGMTSVTWLTSPQLAAACRTGFAPGDRAGIIDALTAQHHRPHRQRGRAVGDGRPVRRRPRPPALQPRRVELDLGHRQAPRQGRGHGRPGAGAHPHAAGGAALPSWSPTRSSPTPPRTGSPPPASGPPTWATGCAPKPRSNPAPAVDEADKVRGLDRKLARGNALTRPYAIATVTAPKTARVASTGARLDSAIRRAGFAPLRLDLSQDVAFAASTIPLGVSLTRKGSS
jgi:hypothetical protein